MSNYLFDSDILIDHLRGARRIEELMVNLARKSVKKSFFYISTVTIGEIFSGQSMLNAAHRKQARRLISSFLKIDLNEPISQKAGELRRIYNIPLIDGFIAASALLDNFILVSRNKRDFYKIRRLKLFVPTEIK